MWQLTAILITEVYYIYKKTILPTSEIAHWSKILFRISFLNLTSYLGLCLFSPGRCVPVRDLHGSESRESEMGTFVSTVMVLLCLEMAVTTAYVS